MLIHPLKFYDKYFLLCNFVKLVNWKSSPFFISTMKAEAKKTSEKTVKHVSGGRNGPFEEAKSVTCVNEI